MRNKNKQKYMLALTFFTVMLMFGATLIGAASIREEKEEENNTKLNTLSDDKTIEKFGWNDRLRNNDKWFRATKDYGSLNSPSGKGARCDQYWTVDGTWNIYYKFQLTDWDLTGSISDVKISVYFDADTVPWCGGPDIYVSDHDGGYQRIKKSMGSPNEIVWKHYTKDEDGDSLSNYVSDNGEIFFYVLNSAGCHTMVEKMKLSWTITNYIPNAFIDSINPNPAARGESVSLSGHGEDPDGNQFNAYQWKDGNTEIGTSKSISVTFEDHGSKTIKFRVQDSNGEWSTYKTKTLTVEENEAPILSNIGGPSSGSARKSYDFKFKATDKNKDKVRYVIDWGDGTDETTNWCCSNTELTVNHEYTLAEEYTISAYSEDNYNNAKSNVVTKPFSTPKVKSANPGFLELLENFPLLSWIFEKLNIW